MVVKRIRVLGPQETLIHAAPEVRCNDLTTTALEDAPGLQGTGFRDGLEAARFLPSLNRRLGPTLAVVPLAGDRP